MNNIAYREGLFFLLTGCLIHSQDDFYIDYVIPWIFHNPRYSYRELEGPRRIRTLNMRWGIYVAQFFYPKAQLRYLQKTLMCY